MPRQQRIKKRPCAGGRILVNPQQFKIRQHVRLSASPQVHEKLSSALNQTRQPSPYCLCQQIALTNTPPKLTAHNASRQDSLLLPQRQHHRALCHTGVRSIPSREASVGEKPPARAAPSARRSISRIARTTTTLSSCVRLRGTELRARVTGL